PTPGLARFAPDGRCVAWLRPADDDFERLDLWIHDLQTGTARCLVDARSLGDERDLTDVEKARRERLRIFSVGIVEFVWSADGRQLYFPLAGRLHAVDVDGSDPTPRPLTPDSLFVTDVRVCGATGAIGFVHAQNLFRMVPGAEPTQLTEDGGGTVSWGLPDFVAAEEMHRFDGYFFSPRGRSIAVLRVDEAPVEITWRQEIDASGLTVHPQRYPYAGAANPQVELYLIDVDSGERRRLEWRGEDSEYLARIDWCPEDAGLLIQRQTRDQSRLDLVHLGTDGAARVVLQESSETWVNLTDDLRIVDGGRRALWTSERDDVRRLFEIDLETGAAVALTPEGVMVERLVQVDTERGEVWVEGTFDARVRRQLYRVPRAGHAAMQGSGATPVRVSDGLGCHTAIVAADCGSWLDRAETLSAPPSLTLRDREGGLLATLVDNDPSVPAHPYHPWHGEHFVPELGEIEAEDGTPLCYRLTRPREDGLRHPVIVAVYGGPGVRRVMDAWPPLLHQYFARRGWGVFELDNRGSSGRGRAFEAPIFHAMGGAEVRDQLAGVAFLRSLDWVDGERLALFGHSYGGYMALMCLAQHPESFTASVSVAPVTDWRLYDTHYTERFMGHPGPDGAAYDSSAVFAHLDGLERAAPGSLLLMHGMADDNVLFTHSTRLMKELQDRNVDFEFMAYPGAKHGIAGAATSKHRFGLIERFLARRFGESN
ncbi:MAG: alpha/beta fold hydrolase, partial [Pseudomonadales bacterium]|nr:alpha/beta fold hydrolase [Pseudomonadales bacterium]